MEKYRHEIFFIASLLNISCCAYPLKALFNLKNQNGPKEFPYEPLKFSYFTMTAWFCLALQSGDFEFIAPGLIGTLATIMCLFFYSNTIPKSDYVFQDILYGIVFILFTYFLPQAVLSFVACGLTVRLYLFSWSDLQALKLKNNWNGVDSVEVWLNAWNTVFWVAIGMLDSDFMAILAFLTGLFIYSQILVNYHLVSFRSGKTKISLD
jgi:hypothetical protein